MIRRPPLAPTFDLPSRRELLGTKVGDWVKLMFESRDEVERMWVRVTVQNGPNEWTGILDNEPISVDYEPGDTIHFHPLDCIAVIPK